MDTIAQFVSKKTSEGIKIFRHHIEFHSLNGPGKEIGLIVMMNPGEARPLSDELFDRLRSSEFDTKKAVPTKPDNTMSKVMRMIQEAAQHNNVSLPNTYTIHIENIFNIREKDNNKAKKLARNLRGVEDLMFKARKLVDDYNFVFFAWGKLDINKLKQRELIRNYPNAIIVNQLNYKGNIMTVDYPVHPLYMNTDFFLKASKGRIRNFM